MSLPGPVSWACHSRRRLLRLAAGGAVFVVVVGSCSSGHRHAELPGPSTSVTVGRPSPTIIRRATAPAKAASTAPTSSTSVTVGRQAPPPQSLPPAHGTAPAGVVHAAVGFVTAWAHPDLPQAVWLAGVKPWATPGLAAGLAYTLPANVPYRHVVGVVASSGDAGGGQVQIRTDSGLVSVVVALTGSRYLVSDIAAG